MLHNKIHPLSFAAAATLGIVPCFAGQNAASSSKNYNVVFIMADQMSAKVVSCYGTENIETKNIDRIAREGVRFENSVCAVPFSSPSRASFVTGMYPNTHGIIKNSDTPLAGLSPQIPTMDMTFYRAGYAMDWFGKWHLGDINQFECYRSAEPVRDSYDRYKAFFEKKNIPAPAARKGEVRVSDKDGGFYQQEFMYDLVRNAPTAAAAKDLRQIGRLGIPVEYYNRNMLTEECVRWIEDNRDKRFMVTLSIEPPHSPHNIPAYFYDQVDPEKITLPESWADHPEKYKNQGKYKTGQYLGEKGTREKIRCYLAQTLMVDAMVGKVLDALDRLGLADKTLVIFTSDHGDPIASHGMLAGKTIDGFVEELTLTPTVMRLPGVIPAGKVVKAHLNSPDIAPTILDAVGLKAPSTMQGKSLLPIIRGEQKDQVGFAVSFRPDARLVRGEVDGKIYTYQKIFSYKDHKTIREELFCISDDPFERKDLFASPAHASVLRAMKDYYNRYAAAYGDHPIDKLDKLPIYREGNMALVSKNKGGKAQK